MHAMTLAALAQKLVDARLSDCAYGDCLSFEQLADIAHGQTVTYDERTGAEGPGNWTRVEITPTPEDWAQAAELAHSLWKSQGHGV